MKTRIGTPPAAGDSTKGNTAGSGRRKPKHTSRYPYVSRCLSSGMSTVLVIAETQKTNICPDRGNFQDLIRWGPPATGPSRSCARTEVVAVEWIGRRVLVLYFPPRRYHMWNPGARPEKQAPQTDSEKCCPHAKFHLRG